MGAEGPHASEGSGVADAPSGVQGQSPVGGPGGEAPGSKMNLMFDIAKNWLSLSTLNKFLKWMADKKWLAPHPQENFEI